jgi:hypothetical protein
MMIPIQARVHDVPRRQLTALVIEDMTIRKLAPKTQQDYVQRVKNFAAFLGRSPDTASFEDVRRYQLPLVSIGVGLGPLSASKNSMPKHRPGR